LLDTGHNRAGSLWDHRRNPGKQRGEERAQAIIEREHHPDADRNNGASHAAFSAISLPRSRCARARFNDGGICCQIPNH
jgi:hypothetical protein